MATKLTAQGLEFGDLTVQKTTIPVGGICLYYGLLANLPTNWQLCDGTNGTPDLRNKFIVGAGGSFAVGDTGGSTTVSLLAPQLPQHTHPLTVSVTPDSVGHSHSGTANSSGAHTHNFPTAIAQGPAGGPNRWNNAPQAFGHAPFPSGDNAWTHSHTMPGGSSSSGAHSHTLTYSIGSSGAGDPHNNLPKYKAVYYVRRMA